MVWIVAVGFLWFACGLVLGVLIGRTAKIRDQAVVALHLVPAEPPSGQRPSLVALS